MVRQPQLISVGVDRGRDVSERMFAVWAVSRLRQMAEAMDRYLGEITFNDYGNIAIAWAYPEEGRDAAYQP